MSTEPQIPVNPSSYTGRYYALPLRGRLTPYEGGTFSAGPSTIREEDAKTAETAQKKAGFSFAGFLDMINPLQHIPVVSSIYRRITGDEITPVGRVAGDTMFFGALGLASSLINTVIEKVTGKDAGDHVMTAMLVEKDKAPVPADDQDDGANNVLAAIPQSETPHGRVTVHPKGVTAPATLDAATLDALSRTIGSAEPLAHLAQPVSPDMNRNKSSAPARSPGQMAAATSYNDALIRMQQGLDQYQTRQPGLELKYAD
ncbi:MAG: hypothetical protein ACLGGZ_01310 [Alphaproteobacteria bacterium]